MLMKRASYCSRPKKETSLYGGNVYPLRGETPNDSKCTVDI